MTQLPAEFTEQTRQLMGDERFERYLKSFEEESPVSIRLNPKKCGVTSLPSPLKFHLVPVDGEPVPWCRHGYYLKQRPNFTFDPLFHAGCYYVQEAASMFLDEVLRQIFPDPFLGGKQGSSPLGMSGEVLDLCAAPGGKSTLLRSALPDDCVLTSNEPIRNRANILFENVSKWGYPNHHVTNVYPEAFRRSKRSFDIILCDVPCSGEGMFRKDEATIREWSPQQVEKCWQLQRDIVSDAWVCLNPGGILIYSTCTFNAKENEENIRWILSSFNDAEVVPVDVKPEWNITGSLLPCFSEPVYRFIPGISRGEGLFVSVLRKGKGPFFPSHENNISHRRGKRFPQEGKNIPIMGEMPLFTDTPLVELTYQQAIAYLRHEALVLPAGTPRGLVTVCFQGFPLGYAKNIGTRANNLYPKEWKIKTTYIPQEYVPILHCIS